VNSIPARNMMKHSWRGRDVKNRSRSVTAGWITTSHVGRTARRYNAMANHQPAPSETAPLTRGRWGLFTRSFSKS
jgi:hypothetical protein